MPVQLVTGSEGLLALYAENTMEEEHQWQKERPDYHGKKLTLIEQQLF